MWLARPTTMIIGLGLHGPTATMSTELGATLRNGTWAEHERQANDDVLRDETMRHAAIARYT